MNKQAYSKTYNQDKRHLKDAIKKFAEENPERFAELQKRALHELEHPPEQPITRHAVRPLHFDVDEFIRQHHTQSYYIRTEDTFGSAHHYFESLDNETPEEVLTRRHTKFTERHEHITSVEKCRCPLCQNLNQ